MNKTEKYFTKVFSIGIVKTTVLCFCVSLMLLFGVLSANNWFLNATAFKNAQISKDVTENKTNDVVLTAEIYDQDGNLVDLQNLSDDTSNNACDKTLSAVSYGASSAAVINTNGGLLQIFKGTYTMNGGTISGLSATHGGAIYVGDGGTFILNAGNISNCSAEYGGAIYVEQGGSLIINGGSITNCSATATDGNGGAIYIRTSKDVSIDGLTIINCTATQYGGAIYNQNASNFYLGKDTIIDTCSAKKGGALYFNRGNVELHCTVQNITTQDNGTIYCGNNATLTLGESVTITNCNVSNNGGAIYAADTTTITMQEGASISYCTASYTAGAIYCATMIMQGGTISNCTANMYGGGVYVNTSMTMSGGEISTCSANEGGGICIIMNASLEMSGGLIDACSAKNLGGGIKAAYNFNTVTISDGIISNCTAISYGAGIDLSSTAIAGGGFILSGGQIINNKLTGTSSNYADSSGAGIHLTCTSVITGGYIAGNVAEGEDGTGGGIYIGGGTTQFGGDCIIENNTAYKGGGVYSSGIFNMTGGTIRNNEAIVGGGISSSYTSNISGGTIQGNTAYSGGGIRIDGYTLTMSGDAKISGNSATYGGGVYLTTGCTLKLTSGYIGVAGGANKASYGAGVYATSTAILNISGGYIRYNSASSEGGGVYHEGTGGVINLSGGSISANNSNSMGCNLAVIDHCVCNITSSAVTINGTSSSGLAKGIYCRSSAVLNLYANPSITSSDYAIYLGASSYIGVYCSITTTYRIYRSNMIVGAVIAYSTNSTYLTSAYNKFTITNIHSDMAVDNGKVKPNYLVIISKGITVNCYVDGAFKTSVTVPETTLFSDTESIMPLTSEQCCGWFFDSGLTDGVNYSATLTSQISGTSVNLYTRTATPTKLTFTLSGSAYTAKSSSSSTSGEVVVPRKYSGKPVSAIGSENLGAITSFWMPDTITTIPSNAFSQRTKMTTINLHNKITSIGSYAFYDCWTLTGVVIPNSVTSIGGLAFYDCYALTSITIPASVKSMLNNIFKNCSGLTSANIQSSLIGYGTFENCLSLSSVTISSNVISIDEQAFAYCEALTKIYIPKSVTTITAGSWSASPFLFTNKNLVIYCGATSIPSGWGKCWNYLANGLTLTYYLGYSSSPFSLTAADARQVEAVGNADIALANIGGDYKANTIACILAENKKQTFILPANNDDDTDAA